MQSSIDRRQSSAFDGDRIVPDIGADASYLVAGPPARSTRRRPFIHVDVDRNPRKLRISSVASPQCFRNLSTVTQPHRNIRVSLATQPQSAIRECRSQSTTSAAESPMPAMAARLERSSVTAKCPAATALAGSGLTHATIRRSAVDEVGNHRDLRRIRTGSRAPGRRGILRLRRP